MALRTPKYRLHRGSGQALVQINGERVYLGKHGTEASYEKYHRIVAEWLASSASSRGLSSPAAVSPNVISVNGLLLAFLRQAAQRYVKNGKPTSEIRSFRTALRPVRELYGREPATNFGPLALVACRQKLIDAGFCRKRINGHVGRIRLVFRWGVARELVPEAVWRALCAVEGLRWGEAPDRPPVRPVPAADIKPVEKYVTPQIWAMIQLQLATGCRPGEVCEMRGMDVTIRDDVWEYRPASHKTQHHGKERVVFLGPEAQLIVRQWLKTDLTAFLFSPREARAWYQEQRAKKRKTPAPKKRRPVCSNHRRQCRDRYRVRAYDLAVERACQRAGVPHWSPGRLRHNAATKIRSEFGIELARVVLGHSSVTTAQIYAEADLEKARAAMRKLG